MSGKGSLWFRNSFLFAALSHDGRAQLAFRGPFYKGYNSSHEGSLLCSNCLSKPLPPDTITLWVRISSLGIWRRCKFSDSVTELWSKLLLVHPVGKLLEIAQHTTVDWDAYSLTSICSGCHLFQEVLVSFLHHASSLWPDDTLSITCTLRLWIMALDIIQHRENIDGAGGQF